MSQTRVGHVTTTQMDLRSAKWLRECSSTNKSCHKYEWVMFHSRTSHVTTTQKNLRSAQRLRERSNTLSCYAIFCFWLWMCPSVSNIFVISPIWMCLCVHLYHTYEWVMSPIWMCLSVRREIHDMSHIQTNYVSRHMYKWVMSHIHMSHVTCHIYTTCHIYVCDIRCMYF